MMSAEVQQHAAQLGDEPSEARNRNDDWEDKASRFSSRRSKSALSHRWYFLRAQGLDGVGSARKASKAMPKAKKKHKYK